MNGLCTVCRHDAPAPGSDLCPSCRAELGFVDEEIRRVQEEFEGERAVARLERRYDGFAHRSSAKTDEWHNEDEFGDFDSDNPYERYLAHQRAKGRIP